ncbi:MAG: adenylate cyclase [Microbacteriaceae bacterium]|jgi:hypothetical protein|nr:adenylate cyclase [Microbacteriaceae bacterium]
MRTTIAVIGAGPRGAGFLERLAANLPVAGDAADVVVHLVDPHPPGAGRIWRAAQSPLLKLNSMARDVTMFTDASSTIDGPVRTGPSLVEWAALVRDGELDVAIDDPRLEREVATLAGDSFPTRRLQSEYLAWFYRRVLDALPARVVEHAASVVRVDGRDGPQRVMLDTGTVLTADIVLYALGHSGSEPQPGHQALQGFARRHDLLYVAPAFTADADTSAIEPGEPVIVRGMGLAAVDLTVLLTEGRGGRFESAAGGGLRYIASGREPVLHLGSRRGVPYHSKISSTLVAPRVEPRFFTSAIAQRLEASKKSLSLRRDVWPLIASELLSGYYHELFVGHPERVATTWQEFAPVLELHAWNSAALREAVAAAVPDPIDRLDLERLDRPLAGERFTSREQLQRSLRDYITADLHARRAPEHSATLALFTSLLYAFFDLGTIIDSPKWTAEARAVEIAEWFTNFFSFIASGPPAHRLEELLALSEAGVVHFLGPDIEVSCDPGGWFVATSPSAPGAVTARVLVDARLPAASVRASDNAALRSLVTSGEGLEELVADEGYSGSTGRLVVRRGDARVVSADGAPHPRRFAIGPYTNAPFVGAFARPGTDAVSFRENDRVAHAVIALAEELGGGPGSEQAAGEVEVRGTRRASPRLEPALPVA